MEGWVKLVLAILGTGVVGLLVQAVIIGRWSGRVDAGLKAVPSTLKAIGDQMERMAEENTRQFERLMQRDTALTGEIAAVAGTLREHGALIQVLMRRAGL